MSFLTRAIRQAAAGTSVRAAILSRQAMVPTMSMQQQGESLSFTFSSSSSSSSFFAHSCQLTFRSTRIRSSSRRRII